MALMNLTQIQVLLRASDDELLAKIGAEWIEAHPGFRLPSAPLVEGRKIFEAALGALRKAICEDWRYCEKREKYGDIADLVAAVADIIVGAKIEIAPAAAAVLLVRTGLDKFCGCKK